MEIREADEVPERLRQPTLIVSAKLAKYKWVRKAGELQSSGVKEDDLPEDVKQGMAEDIADGALEHILRLEGLTILSRVTAWSFGDVVNMDSLLDLPGKTYTAVKDLSGSAADLSEDMGPTPDPASPTTPSTV